MASSVRPQPTVREQCASRRPEFEVGAASGRSPRSASDAESCAAVLDQCQPGDMPAAVRAGLFDAASHVWHCSRAVAHNLAGASPLAQQGWEPDASASQTGKRSPARCLDALRRRVARIAAEYHLPTDRCPCGLPPLDTVLGGGFAHGAVHELVGATHATATRSVALAVAAQAARRGRWAFFLDADDDFHPPGAQVAGLSLGRLIVIRARRQASILWTCEQILRATLAAVVVAPLRDFDTRASRRLQLAAEAGGGLGLFLRYGVATGKTFAASRLRFEPLVGDTEVRRLLVTVLKLRAGAPGEPFVVELPDAPRVVRPFAVPADRSSASRRPAVAG